MSRKPVYSCREAAFGAVYISQTGNRKESDGVNDYILEMKNITKVFPGVKALDDVSLRVRPGTVHSLMGENGAGKSTLMKCLFGIYALDRKSVV